MISDTFETLTPAEVEQTIRRYAQLVEMADMMLPRGRYALDGAEMNDNGTAMFYTESSDGDGDHGIDFPLTAFCGYPDWETFVTAMHAKRDADEAIEAQRQADAAKRRRQAQEAADRATYEELKARFGQ